MLSFILLTASCTKTTIKHIHYNRSIAGYVATQASESSDAAESEGWFVLRDRQTKAKLRDSASAYQAVADFNKGSSGDIDEFKITHTVSIYREYWAGRAYFKGVQALKSGKYSKAEEHFYRALELDPLLKYFSDIYYLRAMGAHQMEDLPRAQALFDTFVDFSESVLPPSFYLAATGSAPTVGYMMDIGHKQVKLSARHVSNHTKGPALCPRLYRGFLSLPSDRPNLNMLLGTGYNSDEGFIFALSTALTLTNGLEPFVGIEQSSKRFDKTLGLRYQIYRRWDNRLGVVGSFSASSVTKDIPPGGDLSFWQYETGLTVGFFCHPRIGLFSGFSYYLWNESRKYESIQDGVIYTAWSENNIFAGVGLFITDHVALMGVIDHTSMFRAGIYVSGMEILLNFN
jgi:tetratricopeptide (TPR) repeat protein